MDNMTDKILDGLTPKVECMENNCSVRYYGKDGGIGLGVIRFTITDKTEGKVPQRIIVINSMDLEGLIGYIWGHIISLLIWGTILSTSSGPTLLRWLRTISVPSKDGEPL